MRDIGSLGEGYYTEAHAINDAGQIVGTSAHRAFLYDHGKMLDLNRLVEKNSDCQLTDAISINNHGQIVCVGNSGAFLLTPIKAGPK